MLELHDVNCLYGKVHVLRGVSLRVDEGEIVSVVGPNAAGKTTTLRTIAGLKLPASGTVRYLGEDITALAAFGRVRRGLVLFQVRRRVCCRWQSG